MDEPPAAPLIIGIGNPDRGDDAAGHVAALLLRDMQPHGVQIVLHGGEPASLVALLADVQTAYLIDASQSDRQAGSIQRFDVSITPLPASSFKFSSHGLGLVEAIELARVLGQLPARCIVYAIEALSFETGTPLSPPVSEAIPILTDRVLAEIS